MPLLTELARRFTFPETEGMYMYTALNKGGSAIYHGYKSSLVPFSENLRGVCRWGKGKEELGTRLITYIHTAHRRGAKALFVNRFTTEVKKLAPRARG